MTPRRRRRWLRWALLWCLAVCAFFTVALGLSSRGARPQALPPASLPVPPWDSPSGTTSSPPQPSLAGTASPALAGPVQVIPGAQLVSGVSLGWPDTAAGRCRPQTS